jgi:glycosyltransferase involved in cell wall biosynthesis
MDAPGTKRHTLMVIRACGMLSRYVPHRIVFCSEESRRNHISSGYCSEKMQVIPNGIDLTKWTRDLKSRHDIRLSFGFPEGTVVIGHLARFHPQKDHGGFIQAALAALRDKPELRFVLAGHAVDWKNTSLASVIHGSGQAEAFRLLGPRDDIRVLMNGFDFLCLSSSYGEAFPNVLLEAMACSVPCVTTDVGDSAYIVGDSGLVVPAGDPERLSAALVEAGIMGNDCKARLGEIGRQRASELFDIRAIVRAYEDLYTSLAAA